MDCSFTVSNIFGVEGGGTLTTCARSFPSTLLPPLVCSIYSQLIHTNSFIVLAISWNKRRLSYLLVVRPHLNIINREASVFCANRPYDCYRYVSSSFQYCFLKVQIQVCLLFVFFRSGTLSYLKPRPSTLKWWWLCKRRSSRRVKAEHIVSDVAVALLLPRRRPVSSRYS